MHRGVGIEYAFVQNDSIACCIAIYHSTRVAEHLRTALLCVVIKLLIELFSRQHLHIALTIDFTQQFGQCLTLFRFNRSILSGCIDFFHQLITKCNVRNLVAVVLFFSQVLFKYFLPILRKCGLYCRLCYSLTTFVVHSEIGKQLEIVLMVYHSLKVKHWGKTMFLAIVKVGFRCASSITAISTHKRIKLQHPSRNMQTNVVNV